MIDEYADSTGVPPKIIIGDDRVQQIRQARAQQEQEAQQAEQLAQGAATAKDLGMASTEDTALGQLTEAVEAGGL